MVEVVGTVLGITIFYGMFVMPMITQIVITSSQIVRETVFVDY